MIATMQQLSRSSNPQPMLQKRVAALLVRKIEFIPNDCFGAVALDAISAEVSTALTNVPPPNHLKRQVASELGSPIATACEMPLLTSSQERALFERMNHLKFLAVRLRAEWGKRPAENAVRQVEETLAEAEQIRNRIVGANVRLVISIAKTFADAKNPLDDLISDGVLSMMHAVEKFDYDRGFRFSTYATRAIRRNLYRVLTQRQKDRTRFGNPSTDLALEVTDDRQQGTMSERRWNELQLHLQRMLRHLPARERQIVKARFGMKRTGKVQTLQSIAKALGVCKERVRQIEKRAIDKLQKMVRDVKIEEPVG